MEDLGVAWTQDHRLRVLRSAPFPVKEILEQDVGHGQVSLGKLGIELQGQPSILPADGCVLLRWNPPVRPSESELRVDLRVARSKEDRFLESFRRLDELPLVPQVGPLQKGLGRLLG